MLLYFCQVARGTQGGSNTRNGVFQVLGVNYQKKGAASQYMWKQRPDINLVEGLGPIIRQHKFNQDPNLTQETGTGKGDSQMCSTEG